MFLGNILDLLRRFEDSVFVIAWHYVSADSEAMSSGRSELTGRVNLTSKALGGPATARILRVLATDFAGQHSRGSWTDSNSRSAFRFECPFQFQHSRVGVVRDAMLAQNRQQIFLTLPGQQIVLSLENAWLDVSCQKSEPERAAQTDQNESHSPSFSAISTNSSTCSGEKLLIPNLLNLPALCASSIAAACSSIGVTASGA